MEISAAMISLEAMNEGRDRAAVGSSARGGTSSMDTVPGKQNGASDRGVTVRNLKE
jgi:hypothetical protein